MSTLHILGIRHHGPGSARSALKALEHIQPDIVLVEGPPDADSILPLLTDAEMRPPIALLIYAERDLSRAAFYPFAEFSPEYQAIRFALARNVPVRFIDLPQRYALATIEERQETVERDPLSELAQSAGYDDAERWWDATVEQRQDSLDLFEAIQEAIAALRQEFAADEDPFLLRREAHMRWSILRAQLDGFASIAVICGAWHAPALTREFSESDAEALRDLPEMPVSATWVPWTYSRLARRSGYGAGVQSPGWYDHLWHNADSSTLSMGWLTKVAQELRKQDLDASPAHVIDTARLVETLAALRGRSRPDLLDMNEAVLSVMCRGNEAPMRLIQRDLIIGSVMGQVPDSSPMVPLQRDFRDRVTHFGLTISEKESELTLDLRDEPRREISHFLYQLGLLDIPWGKLQASDVVFELWKLDWEPGLVIKLIDKSAWGNTVLEAATAFAIHQAQSAGSLPALTALVHHVLFAGLTQAIPTVMRCLENEASTTSDILQLMTALPPLAQILTYGNVRRTAESAVRPVVNGLITRILIGLPAECVSLDDTAAAQMFDALLACDSALQLLDDAPILFDWHTLLQRLMDQPSVHGLVRGRCCRVTVDANFIARVDAVRYVRLALSPVALPADAAAWLQGFLKFGGTLLVYDDDLLGIVDDWLMSLTVDDFEVLLPLVRRVFATFEDPEIQHIGRRISSKPVKQQTASGTVDPKQAANINTTLSQLLGGKGPSNAT